MKPPAGEQARQIAKSDGGKATAWVAAYIAEHGHGPRPNELAKAMSWPSQLGWEVLGRLIRRGWIEFTDGEERSLRPGPAAQQGASR